MLAPIDSYGNGGFRFAGMSHRGSLLCRPDGIWASPFTRVEDIDDAGLSIIIEAPGVTHCLIGSGASAAPLPEHVRQRFRERGMAVECMTTGAAVRTYNILVGERRPVSALLIAVE